MYADPERVMQLVLRHMDGPLVRGVRDCCTQPCAVFGDLFGVNPLGPVSYRTKLEAFRFIRERGGPDACASGIATAAGLVPCAPAPGVIGRIKRPYSELDLTLAICVDGSLWAAKTVDGFEVKQSAIACWGLPWV